jgi:hypothetical protein
VVHAIGQAHLGEDLLGALAPGPAADAAVVRGSRLNPWKMKPMTRLRTMARESPARAPTSIPAST